MELFLDPKASRMNTSDLCVLHINCITTTCLYICYWSWNTEGINGFQKGREGKGEEGKGREGQSRAEKRREEKGRKKIREEKRKYQKKEWAGARKGKKPGTTLFFE